MPETDHFWQVQFAITELRQSSASYYSDVAVALAQALGRAPEPFAVTAAMASVIAFLTPIGHHGNLLVYGPGRYRFSDFVRVGTPLTAICATIVFRLRPSSGRVESARKNVRFVCMYLVRST